MSYDKAMKHARNVRKSRKQGRMHFGLDTGTRWLAPSGAVKLQNDICRWFNERHIDPKGARHARECIREAISDLQEMRR